MESEKKPGRVYGFEKDKPGERFGKGYRFYTHTGEKLSAPFRVEFDADADEGMATISAYMRTECGGYLVDYEKNEPCVATFRTWVRAVGPGQPAPPLTPDAVLWKQPDGSVRWYATDPLPDAAVEAINQACAAAA